MEGASGASHRGRLPGAWRDQRDWTARTYALWDVGRHLGPPSYGSGKPCNRFVRCVCGEVFAMYDPAEVVLHVPHISGAQRDRAGLPNRINTP